MNQLEVSAYHVKVVVKLKYSSTINQTLRSDVQANDNVMSCDLGCVKQSQHTKGRPGAKALSVYRDEHPYKNLQKFI